MSQENVPRFDRLWHDGVVVAYPKLQKHVRLAGRHVAEIRRNVYRFTKNVLLMKKHYHNEFLDMVLSVNKNPTQWMNEHFEVIEAMDDTRERIFAAIENGVTEREYVRRGALVLADRHLKTPRPPKVLADPVVVKPPASIAERANYYREIAESFQSKFQGLKETLGKQNRELRNDLARAMLRVEQLERALKRAEKTLDGALAKPAKCKA